MAAPHPVFADLGNRRLKLAGGSRTKVDFGWREPEQLKDLLSWLEKEGHPPLRLASSSARGLEVVRAALPEGQELQVLDVAKVPLTVETTGTGIDRLLAAWFAWQDCGGAAMVADCGTAFTLDLVSEDGRFMGGAIGAGLGLQQSALLEACPHLDAPQWERPGLLPKDTAAAVGAGTFEAFLCGLEGLAERFAASCVSPPTRYLTGGDAAALAADMPDWRHMEDMVARALELLPDSCW